MISNPRPCVTSGAYYARHKSTSTFHDYYFNNKVQSPAGLKAPYNQVPPGGLDSIRLRRKKKHAHLRSSLFRIVGGTQTSIWKKKFNYKKKKNSISEKMADRSPLAPVCPFVCFFLKKKLDSTEQKMWHFAINLLSNDGSNGSRQVVQRPVKQQKLNPAPPDRATSRCIQAKMTLPSLQIETDGRILPPPQKKKKIL